MTNPLNDRQRAFAENLKRGLTGAQAAIEAGYSPACAPNMASLLRRDPRVRELLAQEQPSDASKSPTRRQITFAWHLRAGHSPVEAASLAGYPSDADAEKLAKDPVIVRLVNLAREF